MLLEKLLGTMPSVIAALCAKGVMPKSTAESNQIQGGHCYPSMIWVALMAPVREKAAAPKFGTLI